MPAFRFLHASDFHLERPPAGMAEVPDHLRELLVEAPYRAAANVIGAAIEHEADFVVLAGDIVAPERSGPRAVLFLREQFSRLAERNVAVYWAGGTIDRINDWPAAIDWPANVYIFPAHVPQRFTAIRHGRPLCEIVGQSLPAAGEIDITGYDAALSTGENSNFVIGIAHGDFDDAQLHSQRIDYWALGGEHEPTLPQETRPLVHHPGSPQGRSLADPGPHGCTLVEVAQNGDIHTTPIVTDVVRYASERLTPPPITSGSPGEQARLAAGDLERLLRERMQSLAEANPAVALVVDFTLGGEPLQHSARSQLPLPTLIGVLRGELGYRSPPVWLDRIRLPSAPSLPDNWFQKENLLGDFLRAARRIESTGEAIDLDRYLPAGQWRPPVGEIVRLNEHSAVQAALEKAAALGAGLLHPEEVRP